MWLDEDLQQRMEAAREQFEKLQAQALAAQSYANELEAKSQELQWKSKWILEFAKRTDRH